MPITVHSNLSLYAVPASFLIGFLPHTIRLTLAIKNGFQFDNKAPRASLDAATTEKRAADPKLANRLERLKAIHTNSLETFPLFATAIIIGNFARLPAKTLNLFAGFFLATRVAFSAFYFYQDSELLAWTGTYFVGMFSAIGILFQSAHKVFRLGQSVL